MKWRKIDSVLIGNTVITTFEAEKTVKGKIVLRKVKAKVVV